MLLLLALAVKNSCTFVPAQEQLMQINSLDPEIGLAILL